MPANQGAEAPNVKAVSGVRGEDEDVRPPGGIWSCRSCHLPRSTKPGACPTCGAFDGRWLVPDQEAGS